MRSSAETNTTDIRIFVRFAIFENNLCYSTIRLQPREFVYVTDRFAIWTVLKRADGFKTGWPV